MERIYDTTATEDKSLPGHDRETGVKNKPMRFVEDTENERANANIVAWYQLHSRNREGRT